MVTVNWLPDFKDPPAHCGHVMFWIWNGEVNERRITQMLEGFAEQGVGGMFVHSRTGLLTEYLSDRWFELWEHSAYLVQTIIQSFGEMVPSETDSFIPWLDEAHEVAENCFQLLCKGALMEKFCGND